MKFCCITDKRLNVSRFSSHSLQKHWKILNVLNHIKSNCHGSYFSFPGLRKHLLRWQMDRGPLSLRLLCLRCCHQAGLLSDLYHRALSIWYPTSCCVYGTTKVWVTVSAITTVESRKLAGRPFTWQHICTVIDVIPYPVTLCLLSPPFTTPNNNDPPSRLQTLAALRSAFMLVDFWRLWCRYEAGWRFDMVPLEFHAPCASKLAKTLSCRYSRNWSFIAFAQEDYQPAPSQGWGSHGGNAALSALNLRGEHFSCHLIWKHVSNPTNLWMQIDPGLYHIHSSRGVFE